MEIFSEAEKEKGAYLDLAEILRRERDEFGADQAHIFGSRARGNFKPWKSDVDIASDTIIEAPRGYDDEFIEGRRSGITFDITRAFIQGEKRVSFLDPTAPHITIRLRKKESV